MRREGQVRVTSTGYPQVGDRRAALDADRLTGVAMLRSALSGLPTPGDLPTLDRLPTPDGPSVAPAPLALAAAGRSLHEPECRTTRAALHDYLARRLLPSRRRRVEAHLDGCGECTRAFIDVRQASWALRDHGRRLAADGHRGGRHRRAPRRRVVAARV